MDERHNSMSGHILGFISHFESYYDSQTCLILCNFYWFIGQNVENHELQICKFAAPVMKGHWKVL